MQFSLFDLLREDHIEARMVALDAFSAIRILNGRLVASGHTVPDFAEDVCTRELTFPTGLPTQPVAVAMPHADPDHVLRSAVAIGTLQSSVQFAQMGTDGSVHLDVHAIFLLAIREREKQVELIQQLMQLIQDPGLLSAMIQSIDAGTVMQLISDVLKH